MTLESLLEGIMLENVRGEYDWGPMSVLNDGTMPDPYPQGLERPYAFLLPLYAV